MHDLIVIGGGFAGMAAALQLLRARRKVLVVDEGLRRNRFAATSHGFLGQDGVPPDTIAANAKAQLMAYPTLTWVTGRAVAASGAKDRFSVTLASGEVHHAARLLLGTGLRDNLPPVPGLAERWGRSVFHCPYCHGYELGEGPLGVLATGPMSVHQAQVVADWGPVTLFLNGQPAPQDPALQADLAGRGIRLEETPVQAIEDDATIALADGRRVALTGVFTAPRCEPSTPMAAGLGCALEETPFGTQIKVDAMKETSLPGVYACGDVARTPHSVTLAVADGAWAGACVHRSLMFP